MKKKLRFISLLISIGLFIHNKADAQYVMNFDTQSDYTLHRGTEDSNTANCYWHFTNPFSTTNNGKTFKFSIPGTANETTDENTLYYINWGTGYNSTNALSYQGPFNSSTFTSANNALTIETTDASKFKFVSIWVYDANQSITIAAYNGGTLTGSQPFTTTDVNGFEGVTLTATDAAFNNVDKIVIYATTYALAAVLDNFTWNTAVLPAPTVTSVSVPANKTYKTGDALTFTVNFDQIVTVTGTPQLSLSINTGGTVQASYTGGSGTSALTFSYTVQSGNQDNDGLTVGSLGLNGGAIKNSGNTAANLTLKSVASTTGVMIDGIAPTVTSVSSSTANGSYKAGSTIAITATFSEIVNVTGTPKIALNSGGTAFYSSGSNSNVLTFNYTVASGENSSDLDYSTTSSLSLNSGTISDGAGNAATLTLPTVGGASSLGGQKNIVIDNVAPTVTLSSTANDPTSVSPIPVTITFSESVTGFDASDITVTNGTKGTLSGSGASYSINVTPSAVGTATINIAAGVAADAAGNSNTAASSLTRNYITVPGVPTSVSATKGNGSASVSFTAPASNGGSAITSYTVTSNPDGKTGTETSSPITVSGLTNGTSYTFTVTATNGVGISAASAPSNPVTPSVATGIDDAKLEGVTIYPNPVDDRLYIKGVDEGEVSVYDMGGSKVISAILANTQAVDVSGLAKGVYTVRITTPNGKVEKKLVKK